jgi:hypothetical protein
MLSEKFTKQILGIQFFGIFMFAVVCTAYSLQFLTGDVMHGELVFRIVIGTFGSVFLVGTIIMLIVAYFSRKTF